MYQKGATSLYKVVFFKLCKEDFKKNLTTVYELWLIKICTFLLQIFIKKYLYGNNYLKLNIKKYEKNLKNFL